MMKNLRDVILKDAALLIDAGRRHVLFSLPVFQTAEYREYQSEIVEYVRPTKNPVTERAKQADLILYGRLLSLESSVNGLHQQQVQQYQQLASSLANLSETAITRPMLQNVLVSAAGALGGGIISVGVAAASAANANFAEPQSAAPRVPVVEDPPSGDACGASRPLFNSHLLVVEHRSVHLMYNEWHSIGLFIGIPIPGGIAALEESSRDWRGMEL
jgi:hypothetical protein